MAVLKFATTERECAHFPPSSYVYDVPYVSTESRHDRVGSLRSTPNKKMIKSVVRCAKVLLFLLNIWVLSVVLVVVLGKWPIFESRGVNQMYDQSHLVMMRELKQDGDRKSPAAILDKSKSTLPEAPEVVAKRNSEAVAVRSEQREVSEQEDRVHTMRHWCSKLKPNLPSPDLIPSVNLQQILVDDHHKLLYCQIPGVALNDWRKILVFLSGAAKVKSHLDISAGDIFTKYAKHIKRLSDFSAPERRKRIEKYFKMSFVREPLERLYSSYDSKFRAKWSTYFHLSFGRKIIAKYRKKPSKTSLEKGNDVTFAEFVQYVLDSENQGEKLNEHWVQFYKQCHPCLIPYDFIGKYESLNHDIDQVLKKINARDKIHGSLVASNYTFPLQELSKMFKTVPVHNLQKLWKVYYPDYSLFSYQYPHLLQNLIKSKDFSDY